MYTEDQIQQLDEGCLDVTCALRKLSTLVISTYFPNLTHPKAKEYATHGLLRRISIIVRCIEQVFDICPPDRTELLDRNELLDIQIALHAFVINIHGALDNLAWCLVFEKLPTIPKRSDVGLLKNTVRKLLPIAADRYLHEPKTHRWLREYSTTYRDTLAHRIPLYVPPMALSQDEQKQYEELEKQIGMANQTGDFDRADELSESQQKLGSIYPVFAHSFDDDDATPPVLFHVQMIADGRTLIEIVKSVTGVR